MASPFTVNPIPDTDNSVNVPQIKRPANYVLEFTIRLLTYFVTRSQTNSVSATGLVSSAVSTRNVSRSGP